jgi:fatty acid desaturase
MTHCLWRIISTLAFFAFSLYILCTSDPLSIKWFIGLILISVAYLQGGGISHESGHHSLFTNKTLDRITQRLFFNLYLGGSLNYWNMQHNKHHAWTQH